MRVPLTCPTFWTPPPTLREPGPLHFTPSLPLPPPPSPSPLPYLKSGMPVEVETQAPQLPPAPPASPPPSFAPRFRFPSLAPCRLHSFCNLP